MLWQRQLCYVCRGDEPLWGHLKEVFFLMAFHLAESSPFKFYYICSCFLRDRSIVFLHRAAFVLGCCFKRTIFNY